MMLSTLISPELVSMITRMQGYPCIYCLLEVSLVSGAVKILYLVCFHLGLLSPNQGWFSQVCMTAEVFSAVFAVEENWHQILGTCTSLHTNSSALCISLEMGGFWECATDIILKARPRKLSIYSCHFSCLRPVIPLKFQWHTVTPTQNPPLLLLAPYIRQTSLDSGNIRSSELCLRADPMAANQPWSSPKSRKGLSSRDMHLPLTFFSWLNT